MTWTNALMRAMWAEETINDIYDASIKDDKFALIALLNEKCQVKVKTPVRCRGQL